MNKVTRILYHLILACLALSLMVGCTASPATSPPSNGETPPAYQVDKVEAIYFHRTQRCRSCIYVEEKTRYTIETYFKDELASGKVTFKVLNIEDKENGPIVEKYGAFTSSLFINTIGGGSDHIEEAMDVYFLISKDDAFVEAVRSKIERSLKGEG